MYTSGTLSGTYRGNNCIVIDMCFMQVQSINGIEASNIYQAGVYRSGIYRDIYIFDSASFGTQHFIFKVSLKKQPLFLLNGL